ncbi:hypothetical protein CH380_08105 [Leptospira adleri]|uniref:Uncharacterized protein n=1 Tax=Leptospira adleri TaxID=2023186 RepID=A0A2M9YQZ4_9LEPT|nr:hypothetical protein CH380_08105 [Leptospira adleri]PJZ62039.1 hypothetical protein CH376_10310 [Leptospira adleri]
MFDRVKIIFLHTVLSFENQKTISSPAVGFRIALSFVKLKSTLLRMRLFSSSKERSARLLSVFHFKKKYSPEYNSFEITLFRLT